MLSEGNILWVVLILINSISDNFRYVFVINYKQETKFKLWNYSGSFFSMIFNCMQKERERQTTDAHFQKKNPNENIKVRRPKKVTVVFSVVIARRCLSTSLTAKYLNGHWTSFCKFSLRFYARVIIRKDAPRHVLLEKNYLGYCKESIV